MQACWSPAWHRLTSFCDGTAARGRLCSAGSSLRKQPNGTTSRRSKTLPSADAIKGTNLTCFNIGGNNFRLLTLISYERQQVHVHELMTHEQYTKKYVR